jgi:hypothetical protein
MNLLVTDPYNKAATEMLTNAVQANGLTVTVVDLGTDPNVIQRYGLGAVPCLAFIHDDRAIDLIADDWIVGKSAATIKGRFTKAKNDYDAERAV